MKTAKEYYTDIFEGIRLSVCGLAMLAVCGGGFVVSKLNGRRKQKEKNKGQEDKNGCEIEDAHVVGDDSNG